MERSRAYDLFLSPKGIAPLVTFRILFGTLMAVGIIRFWASGWLQKLFLEPTLFFKYRGFEWVVVNQEFHVYVLAIIAILGALGIAFGFLYRISATLFFLSFTYMELLDATNYLNHYYLVVLFSFLLIFLPANRKHSLDVRFGLVKGSDKVPAFAINILIAQMVIVYTYAGLAKLNPDWLFRAMPLRIWLAEYGQVPLVGSLLAWKGTAFIFSWFGAIYDLTIGYFMLWKRTRKWAYVFVIVFHSLTGLLFNIGLFPVIMITSTLIFFSEEWHLRIHRFLGLRTDLKPSSLSSDNLTKRAARYKLGLIEAYLILQILLPLRHYVIPGETIVTEEGYRFSWKVMLVEKAGVAEFTIVDQSNGRSMVVDNSLFLTSFQEKQMAIQPEMMVQYAKYLADYYKGRVADPAIYVRSVMTLNGRSSVQYIDPNVDLLKQEHRPLQHNKWIVASEFPKQ